MVDEEIVKEIDKGYEDVVSKTNKKIKKAFMKQALDVMNERLPKEIVQEILEANACCKSGVRLKASKEFARQFEDKSIEERLKIISKRPYMNMGSAELDKDGFLIVNAVSYHPKERFECACPTISHTKCDYEIPREYCYCCGGHFKFHYEIMLDVKLELCSIVSSPHDTDGQKSCVFKYRIVNQK